MTASIIVDAADFIDNMPRGCTLENARSAKVSWFYNNMALALGCEEDLTASIEIPEPGRYTLYVRSHGNESTSFRVSIGGQEDPAVFGNMEAGWSKGGTYELEKGRVEVRIGKISLKPLFDVIVLTTDNDFDVSSFPHEALPDEVSLLKEYKICRTHTVKFGDVLGNGKIGFAAFESDYSTHVYDNDGNELWTYKALPITELMENRREFEPPAVIWDIDNDGISEVIHWRYMEGKTWLVIADGPTGSVKNRTEFPCVPPNAFYNYRIAVAKLEPGFPSNLIVFADSGGTISINAYSRDLTLLWSHVEHRKKDNLGHYIYPKDINDDGIDEIIVGALALDSKGKVIWDRLCPDNHDHVDSIRFIDINGDGHEELVTAYSDLGVKVLSKADGHVLWEGPAAHTQQIETGYFLKDIPGPQVAAGARIYSRKPGTPYLSAHIYWYDCKGNLVKIWPTNWLNGNPDFVKGDWRGTGRDELFWYRFKIGEDGSGKLYFPYQVYHMFDFDGDGAEEVITLDGDRLAVYGCKYKKRNRENAFRSAEYMYRKVANHTHY